MAALPVAVVDGYQLSQLASCFWPKAACCDRPLSVQAVRKYLRLSNPLIVEIVAGTIMKRLIEGEARTEAALMPDCLDDYITEESPVRVVDVFVDELDLGALGFNLALRCGSLQAVERASRYHSQGWVGPSI